MRDIQVTIDHKSEFIQEEKETLEPLLTIDSNPISNEKKEPLCFTTIEKLRPS